jgi:3-oxoacyl-[acyl-carrier protein] reductase
MPHFVAQKSGDIVNISSCITQNPTTGLTWYGASKGAVDMATRHLAAEYATHGIRVNSVSPSIGNTALFKDFVANDAPDDAMVSSLYPPLGRLCAPLDIAKGTLYLATPYFNEFQT